MITPFIVLNSIISLHFPSIVRQSPVAPTTLGWKSSFDLLFVTYCRFKIVQHAPQSTNKSEFWLPRLPLISMVGAELSEWLSNRNTHCTGFVKGGVSSGAKDTRPKLLGDWFSGYSVHAGRLSFLSALVR